MPDKDSHSQKDKWKDPGRVVRFEKWHERIWDCCAYFFVFVFLCRTWSILMTPFEKQATRWLLEATLGERSGEWKKQHVSCSLQHASPLCWHGDFVFPPPGEMGCVSVLFYITWNIGSLAFFHKSLTWHSLEHSDISQLHKRHREKMAYLLRLGVLPTGQSPALWKAAVPSDRKITGSGWVTD